MVTDDDLLEKDDLYILDRMKSFVSNSEVANFAAAKQLLILIERAVRENSLLFVLYHVLNCHCSNEELMLLSRQRTLSLSPRLRPLFRGPRKSSSYWTSIPQNWRDSLHLWKRSCTRRFAPWNACKGPESQKRGRPVIISRLSYNSVTGYAPSCPVKTTGSQLCAQIANWVAETVLSREDSRKRATIVKHFIGVADVSVLLVY